MVGQLGQGRGWEKKYLEVVGERSRGGCLEGEIVRGGGGVGGEG